MVDADANLGSTPSLPGGFVVAIDGQASTGKSSVGQRLAQRLGAAFLDTGAMYRGVTALCLSRGVSVEDAHGVMALAESAAIDFDWSVFPPKLTAFGSSISDELRSASVDGAVSAVAAIGPVRSLMVRRQREFSGEHARLVTEGRDQGTVVFPDAMAKFFLVADPEERARRRCAQNPRADYASVLANLIDRDRRDSSRAVGPMAVAPDAVVVDTTTLTEAGVVDHLESFVRAAALRRASR